MSSFYSTVLMTAGNFFFFFLPQSKYRFVYLVIGKPCHWKKKKKTLEKSLPSAEETSSNVRKDAAALQMKPLPVTNGQTRMSNVRVCNGL